MAQLSWKKQALAAGGLLALSLGTFWLEFKHKPETESKEEQKKKLFPLGNGKDTPVDGIVLRDGAGHVYSLRCLDMAAKLCKPGDNSKWELLEPSKLRADDTNANSLVSSLNNLNVVDTIDLKDETPAKKAALLKEYGLDEGSRAHFSMKKVEVKAAGVTQTVYLGAHHPIGDSIFGVMETGGKLDDTKVFLVPTYFKANFDHDLTYWRDKKLMSVAAHEIEAFRLEGSHGVVSGARKDGAWSIQAGAGPAGKPNPSGSDELSGDIEAVDSLLTAATYLTAKEFTADRKSDAKATAILRGTRKLLTISLSAEKGQAKEQPTPVILTLYSKGSTAPKKADPKNPGAAPATGSAGKIYATLSNTDPLYEVELSVRDRLDKELKDLRLSKLVTSMERFTAKRLQFSSLTLGSPPLVLINKDGKWINEATPSSAVSNERVQALLDRVSGNRIKQFVTGAAIPGGQESGITFKLGDGGAGDSKRQLLFWTGPPAKGAEASKNAKPALYARDLLSSRKEAFLVDGSIGEELPRTRDHFAKPPAAPAGAPGGPHPGMPNVHGGMPGAPPAPGQQLLPPPPEKK